jgi:catechol 2,3-dioxygenase-like lactoylglutathione lyase family enzyme
VEPDAPQPTVDELTVADPPEPWRATGFAVHGRRLEVGSVRIALAGPGPGRGIVGWSVRDARSLELDGLPSTASSRPPPAGGEHPNGALAVDHIVAMTPDLDRSVAALRAGGLDLRRVREEPTPGGAPRQGFFRMGEVILEVVQAPEGTRVAAGRDGPARLWGLAFRVESIDRPVAALGDLLGEPRAAVQAGRTIATVRRAAGLGPAVAFITPP